MSHRILWTTDRLEEGRTSCLDKGKTTRIEDGRTTRLGRKLGAGATRPRIAALFACLALATCATAETLLLRNATVHTVAKGTLMADVLIKDDRIAAVLPDAAGAGLLREGKVNEGDVEVREGRIVGPAAEKVDRTIDLKGLHLFPGLIGPSTDLGLVEISGVRASVDDRETGEFTPEVESWVAVNPDSELIPVARANGITHFAPIPQGKFLTGTSAMVAARGWTIEDMTIRRRTAMHLVWPDQSLSVPGPNASPTAKSLDEQARERREKVRSIEQFFDDAAAWERRADGGPAVPAWEAMLPVLRGEIPLMIHAQSQREIKAALKWSEPHSRLRIVLVGGRDSWMLADELAKRKIPVIYSEVFALPGRGSDAYDVQFSAPAVLHKAGVTVAISEGLDRASAYGQRNLPYIAAQAAAFGLPPDAALASITLVPAQLHGVADKLGSIEVGKDASLIAATGDILDIRSQVKHLWISGVEQSLESRHTRLAERYRSRPKAKE